MIVSSLENTSALSNNLTTITKSSIFSSNTPVNQINKIPPIKKYKSSSENMLTELKNNIFKKLPLFKKQHLYNQLYTTIPINQTILTKSNSKTIKHLNKSSKLPYPPLRHPKNLNPSQIPKSTPFHQLSIKQREIQ
jgi:hypothetical protein